MTKKKYDIDKLIKTTEKLKKSRVMQSSQVNE